MKTKAFLLPGIITKSDFLIGGLENFLPEQTGQVNLNNSSNMQNTYCVPGSRGSGINNSCRPEREERGGGKASGVEERSKGRGTGQAR